MSTLPAPGAPGWRPYADGTSGQQGEASTAAEPSRRLQLGPALAAVKRAGPKGITWTELAWLAHTHHGQASGALSNLHRSGLILRLAERRGRCGIYVTPDNVADRPTVPHRSNKRTAQADALAGLRELVARLMAEVDGPPSGYQRGWQDALRLVLQCIDGEDLPEPGALW
jgi:hypothetical protein